MSVGQIPSSNSSELLAILDIASETHTSDAADEHSDFDLAAALNALDAYAPSGAATTAVETSTLAVPQLVVTPALSSTPALHQDHGEAAVKSPRSPRPRSALRSNRGSHAVPTASDSSGQPAAIGITSETPGRRSHRHSNSLRGPHKPSGAETTGKARSRKTPLSERDRATSFRTAPASNRGDAKAFESRADPHKTGRLDIYQTIKRRTHKGTTLVIEDFQLGEKLGKGQYGKVYKGLNMRNGQFVAVKRMNRELIDPEELEREVEILKKLSHQNIVKYIGLVQSSGHLNLVLEYVESGSVAKVLAEYGFFPESLAAIYTEQVLVGLEYLHGRGVIHRDIKGGNLLITKEGIIKLADFGLAQTSKHASSSTTTPGASAASSAIPKLAAPSQEGSPFWMSPEVCEMQPNITSATDIWSLGCTLIELLTGYPPYFDMSAMNAMWKMASEDHPPLPDDISTELEDFLLGCFERTPAKRPTASALLDHPWILKFSKRDRSAPSPTTPRATSPSRRSGEHRPVQPHLDADGLSQSVRKYNEARENPHANPRSLASLDWTRSSDQSASSSSSSSASSSSSSASATAAVASSIVPLVQLPSSASDPTASTATSDRTSPRPSPREHDGRHVPGTFSSPALIEPSQNIDDDVCPESPRSMNGEEYQLSLSDGNAKFSTTGIKKFSFKDLKDRFEALSTQTDYVVYITGYENQRNFMFSYTVFRLKVCLEQRRWHIYRTFSDFKELHSKLEKALPAIRLPPLPGSKFFGVMDAEFIKTRKNELQIYAESLLKIPSVKSSHIFQFFLTANSQPA